MDTSLSWDQGGDAATEETPLLYRSARYRVPEHLQPYTTEGPCFAVLSPPEPCDEHGRPPPPQLLKYNPRYATSALSVVTLRGTAFASWSLWLHVLGNLAFACIVWMIVFFGAQRPELIQTERVAEVVFYSSAMVGFLLVFYLSVAVRRWWGMRVDTIGGLRSAVGDLSLVMAAHLPQPGTAELKALVLRYCLASLELTFMQAQGTDGVLDGLVRQKLLTDDEKRKLEELVSKPQAMWVWIAGIFQQLSERGKLSPRLLVSIYQICARARGSVGRGRGAFAYLDTQMPFTYVHFLSVLVHLNNLAIAIKCGALAAIASWNLMRSETKREPVSDAENIQVLALQGFFVLIVPALYHAVLEEAAALSDPFGDKFRDFPRKAHHLTMRSECEALITAGEHLPEEALQVSEEFQVREGDVPEEASLAAARKDYSKNATRSLPPQHTRGRRASSFDDTEPMPKGTSSLSILERDRSLSTSNLV